MLNLIATKIKITTFSPAASESSLTDNHCRCDGKKACLYRHSCAQNTIFWETWRLCSCRSPDTYTDTDTASLTWPHLPVPLNQCACATGLCTGNWMKATGSGQQGTGNRQQATDRFLALWISGCLLLAVSSSSGRRMDDVPTVTGFLMMAPNTLNKSIMLFHPHRSGNTIPGIVTTSGPATGALVFGHRGSIGSPTPTDTARLHRPQRPCLAARHL